MGKKSVTFMAIVCVMAGSTSHGQENTVSQLAGVIPNQYIVVLNRASEIPPAAAADLVPQIAAKHGVTPRRIYTHLLPGFSFQGLPDKAAQFAADPNVAYVVPDHWMFTSGVQSSAPYHLDRIDQRDLPLDGTYAHDHTGSRVNLYVLDSGVRHTHEQFGGRARLLWDAFDGDQSAYCPPQDLDPGPIPHPVDPDGSDDSGHGTHVAGLAGGVVSGAAKGVKLWDVRVTNCRGVGQWGDIRAGLDEVVKHKSVGGPQVVNMSLGGPKDSDTDNAVRKLSDPDDLEFGNVTVVVSAGNSGTDACSDSPAGVEEAITVAASNASDARWNQMTFESRYASNFGSCVDIFAPGQAVESAYNTDDTATASMTGTSMATPLVAGVVAMYLDSQAALGNIVSSAQAAQAIRDNASRDKLDAATIGAGSPNLLLYNWLVSPAPPPPPPEPGELVFSASAYTTPESGAATITVKRVGGNSGAISVQYETFNGTATAGADYVASSGTLEWIDGNAEDQEFLVTILADSQDEPDETVGLRLFSPFGADLGNPSTAQLTIVDDDASGPGGNQDCPYRDPQTGIWTYCD